MKLVAALSDCDATVASYELLLAQELVGTVVLSIVGLVGLPEVTVDRLTVDDDDNDDAVVVLVVVTIGGGIVVALFDIGEVEVAIKSINDVVLKKVAVELSESDSK